MSIDEAIAHEREVAKEIYVEAMLCHANPDDGELDDCIQRGKYHEQLAEWLEELKDMRNLDKTNFSDGYNRAIDDCLNIIENCCWKDSEMLVELVKELNGGDYSE